MMNKKKEVTNWAKARKQEKQLRLAPKSVTKILENLFL